MKRPPARAGCDMVWTKIGDGLPIVPPGKYAVSVLCFRRPDCTCCEGHVAEMHFNKHGKFQSWSVNGAGQMMFHDCFPGQVTHWQEMPAPPIGLIQSTTAEAMYDEGK